MIIQTLNKNTDTAQESLRVLARNLSQERPCECGSALASALITNPAVIPAETLQKLDAIVRKYYK
jgi:5'-methylthioadenosine phosphorylase